MSLNHLTFATISIIILAANLSARLQSSEAFEVAQNQQATTINFSAETLKQPYWLSIRTFSANQIRGQITLNGKVIQVLNRDSTTINLSPYLKVGRQAIAITGTYSPPDALVTIELQGKNTQVKQQTSGSGLLDQFLTVEVR